MRFEKLLLRAFGPFTDRTLDFASAAPAGLHLIYGPNEAGKSSSLRATVALLFGIALRSDDDFVHAHPDMRVGAVVRTRDGQRIAVMRRKANRAPLRLLDEATGRDDEPAGAEVAALLTGGLDRDLFESMFGIDHVRLREGGRQLLAGEGELGASLFQAGSGLANVRSVLDRLDSEARERFVPRGTNPPINDALRRLEELRRQQRDCTTRPREWAELAAAVEQARRRDDELAAQMQTLRTEQRQLVRLRATLPHAARHAQLAAELAALIDAPELPADATERRLRAEAERDRARRAAEQAAIEADALRLQRDAVAIDRALLAHADVIARLHHDADRAAQIERDRAVCSADAARLAARIGALSGRIHATGAAPAPEPVPSAAVAAGVREAAARLVAAQQAADAAAHRAASARDAAAHARAMLAALPPAPTLAALAAAHASAVALGAIDHDIAAAQARLAQADARIDDGARGLGAADAAALRRAVPPPAGHAQALAARLAALRAELAHHDDDARRLAAEVAALQTERAQLAAAGEIVTADMLATTRDARDALWHALRAQLADGCASGPEADAFERAVREADRQADLLRADADRAARFAAIERELLDRATRTDHALAQSRTLAEAQTELIDAWSARLWAAGVPFMEPDAFVRWHERRDAWIAQGEARDEAQAALAARCALRAEARRTLTQALQDAYALQDGQTLQAAHVSHHAHAAHDGCAVPDAAAVADRSGPAAHTADMQGVLSVLVEAAAACLATAQQRAEARANAQRALGEAMRTAEHACVEHAAAQRQAEQALAAWNAAIAPLWLAAGATPAQAEARLGELDELDRLHAQWTDARNACDAHSAWLEQRQADIAALAGLLSRELPDVCQAAVVVATWHAAAQAAFEAQRHARTLDEQIAAARDRHAREMAAVDGAERTLAQLQAAAGCPDAARMPELERRAARKRQLAEDLRTLEAQLLQSGDRPLEALLREAEGRDADAVARRLDAVTAEIERLEPQSRAAQQALVDAGHRLALIDGSDAAATAREALEATLARLRNDALGYARARLAHALLDAALATYQERAQGPLIERATRLFAAITAQRYVRLRVVDDGDRRVLVAERHDGAPRRIEQLSEGTRDVLYLSLRLAALDLHLDGNPPMPLVLDDILLTFDDARAAATLTALAALSRRTQVLLFTHHEHLLDVAACAVEPRDLAVHRLG